MISRRDDDYDEFMKNCQKALHSLLSNGMHSLFRQLQGRNGAWRSLAVGFAYLPGPRNILDIYSDREKIDGRY